MMNILQVFVFYYISLVSCLDQRNDSVEVTKVEKAPFTVLVMCNNNKYFCTGAIIHAEWALTAAHCMYDMEGKLTEGDHSVTVLAGVDALDTYEQDLQSGKGQARQSVKLEIHLAYTWSANFIHDIALIKLDKPLKLTKRAAVAPLPRDIVLHKQVRRDTGDSKELACNTYGFGKIKRLTSYAHDFYLKRQSYEVSKHCHCLEKIRLISSPYNVLKSESGFICDEVDSFTGFCCGDNGGPLICDNILRGMATALLHFEDQKYCIPQKTVKYECGDHRSMDIFTDICSYSEWIHSFVPEFPVTDENCNVNVSVYIK